MILNKKYLKSQNLKIGPKIKAYRRQLGIHANKLVEQTGISASYLNLIESGKRNIDSKQKKNKKIKNGCWYFAVVSF